MPEWSRDDYLIQTRPIGNPHPRMFLTGRERISLSWVIVNVRYKLR